MADWFQKDSDHVYELDKEPMIVGKELSDQKDEEAKIWEDVRWVMWPAALHEMTTTKVGDRDVNMMTIRLSTVQKENL